MQLLVSELKLKKLICDRRLDFLCCIQAQDLELLRQIMSGRGSEEIQLLYCRVCGPGGSPQPVGPKPPTPAQPLDCQTLLNGTLCSPAGKGIMLALQWVLDTLEAMGAGAMENGDYLTYLSELIKVLSDICSDPNNFDQKMKKTCALWTWVVSRIDKYPESIRGYMKKIVESGVGKTLNVCCKLQIPPGGVEDAPVIAGPDGSLAVPSPFMEPDLAKAMVQILKK